MKHSTRGQERLQKVLMAKGWDLSDHLQSPKPRNPEKSQKSLPRRVWDPPPTPESSEKSPKSPKIVNMNYSWTFRNFLRNFSGSRVGGGPKLLSGDFFETFRGFGVLGSVGRGFEKGLAGGGWRLTNPKGFLRASLLCPPTPFRNF